MGDRDSEILLVEDSPGDAEHVLELFADERSPWRVRHVRALSAAVQNLPGSFRLILLDLGLPDARGLDVLHAVYRAAAGAPIVVLTGRADADLARQCLEHGAQDYLHKGDLDGRALMRAIDYASARERARVLSQRLEHADRLTTIGRLAATVAHEVNNPAAFIRLNTEDLLHRIDELATDAEAREVTERRVLLPWLSEARGMVADNLDGIERVTRLVQDLQVFARVDDLRPEPVDVATLCRSTCNLAAHHVRHRSKLILDLHPTPTIVTDRGRLGQVIMNLVVNAAQSIDGDRGDAEVRVQTRHQEGWITIAVADTGRGMDAEHVGRVFDRFYSTKMRGNGIGLGLSICSDIVEAIGGKIDVRSEVDRGSCFTVWIPALGTDAEHAEAPVGGEPVDEPKPRRQVLLVDDDEALVRAVARGLSRYHEVQTASDGHVALGRLERGEQFDVIVCDLMMPEVDGVEFVERIGRQFPGYQRRILILSGGPGTDRAAAFLDHTDRPVLAKPVLLCDLARAVETVAAQCEGTAEGAHARG